MSTITSDAGAVLLRETDRRLGLLPRLAGCFEGRTPPGREARGQHRIAGPHSGRAATDAKGSSPVLCASRRVSMRQTRVFASRAPHRIPSPKCRSVHRNLASSTAGSRGGPWHVGQSGNGAGFGQPRRGREIRSGFAGPALACSLSPLPGLAQVFAPFHTACAVGYHPSPLPGLVAHVSAILAYRYAQICSIGALSGNTRLTVLPVTKQQAICARGAPPPCQGLSSNSLPRGRICPQRGAGFQPAVPAFVPASWCRGGPRRCTRGRVRYKRLDLMPVTLFTGPRSPSGAGALQ